MSEKDNEKDEIIDEKDEKELNINPFSSTLLLGKGNTEGEEKQTIKERTVDEVLNQIFSVDNLAMKTDLNPQLILAMSRGLIYADKFKSKTMTNFINNLQVLSISKGRKGRQELVAVIRNSQEVPDNTEYNMMSRLFNK